MCASLRIWIFWALLGAWSRCRPWAPGAALLKPLWTQLVSVEGSLKIRVTRLGGWVGINQNIVHPEREARMRKVTRECGRQQGEP